MTHSYKVHFFHLIWSTKNREPFISKELQSDLYSYIGGIIRNYNGGSLEIGGMPDHIHILLSFNNLPKYFDLIRDIKSQSSLWIHKKFRDLPLKNFEWQEGYASLTVSYSYIETVRKYIQNQEKHHQKMTFEEEYLKFLIGQNIHYDERFVFG